jgi:hypothetical protein
MNDVVFFDGMIILEHLFIEDEVHFTGRDGCLLL